MTGASYIPGSWLGIVRSRTAVLLGPGSPAELAGALWELLAGRPEPHEVLAAVTSTSGGFLTRIPSFGILDFNGSLRIFLRGDIDLTVDQPGGAVDLDGRDVTTWNERRFVVPGTCRVVIAGGGAGTPGHAAEHPELPLSEGVVLLQSLTLGAPSGPAAVGGPPAAEGMPETALLSEATLLPAATFRPEHGAPAETVLGVIDEDPADGHPAGGVADAPAAEGLDPDRVDPDATIAPDGIIGVDGETGTGGELLGEADAEPELPETAGGDDTSGAPAGTGAGPAEEMTSSYDHLWDRTVMRHIEDAAVREDIDADSGHVSRQQPPALAAAEPMPALGAAEDPAPEIPPASSGTGPGPASSGVLIDSVPWRIGGATPAAPAPSTPPTPGTPAAPQATPFPAPSTPTPTASRVGPAGPASVSVPVPGSAAGQEPVAAQESGAGSGAGFDAGFDPDHDGQTVMKGSLRGTASGPALNASDGQQGAGQQGARQQGAGQQGTGRPDAGGGPLVLARVCAQGHANPPTRAQCSACGAALLPDAVQVARPRLGRMRLSTGELLDLDQSMVIGRQPSVSRVQGGVMPRLVQVASPGGDISRSHLEVRLEGWHVMLCDLKATNGTVLVREGQPPRRLAQNEMAILLDGDIAELGDNISLRFEEIP
ncbi:FHA domain-containing protein [Pseudarthrobacter sp. BRE9]|uniref:FHA domain-containing protein n=1 Tax=Pseudarthrobacter sp. BRE9 TaxID=2962582 RepID=UPI00288230E5|nr:FHA domain-containing protein [Pseudarthrobacter sp. BRE9]MDT0169953.1 FHA domain-containing protein [Pseudarthrobacter sp. BRE9]